MSHWLRLLIVTEAAVVVASLGDGGPGWLGWLGLLAAAPACAMACVEASPRLQGDARPSGALVGVLGGAAGVAFAWVAGAAGSLVVWTVFTAVGLLLPVGAVHWMRRVRPAPAPTQPTKTASGRARVPAGR